MNEEILNLTKQANILIAELENYLFTNLKEKYIASKGILDTYKEHIEEISSIVDYELTPEEIEAAKNDLNFIVETIKNGKSGLTLNDAIDKIEVEESNKGNNFSEEDIDSLLKTLDENTFETVFPQESAPTIEATQNLNANYENNIDVNALDAFLGNDSQ